LIQDGGANGGAGGSLAKIGTGKLTLTSANTYTGGTIVKNGKLVVTNRTGSGTGSGTVQVNAGTLGGTGEIAGDVFIGIGSGPGAILAPGKTATTTGTLTVQGTVRFNSDATYKVQLNSTAGRADRIVANGVTIDSGAQFSFSDVGNGTLPPATIFTAIDNTSVNPIAGTFSNLPDGATFSSNGNTYQASYEGGDGNDLTLTVVP
jgi:autotransporter-associated beta strand protein